MNLCDVPDVDQRRTRSSICGMVKFHWLPSGVCDHLQHHRLRFRLQTMRELDCIEGDGMRLRWMCYGLHVLVDLAHSGRDLIVRLYRKHLGRVGSLFVDA